MKVYGEAQCATSMYTISFALNEGLAIRGEKALIVAHQHSSRIVGKLKLHLAKHAEVKGPIKPFHYRFYQNESGEVVTGKIFVSCNGDLFCPGFGTDLRSVYTQHGKGWFRHISRL